MKGLLFTMYWQHAGSQAFSSDTGIYDLTELFLINKYIITHLWHNLGRFYGILAYSYRVVVLSHQWSEDVSTVVVSLWDVYTLSL